MLTLSDHPLSFGVLAMESKRVCSEFLGQVGLNILEFFLLSLLEAEHDIWLFSSHQDPALIALAFQLIDSSLTVL